MARPRSRRMRAVVQIRKPEDGGMEVHVAPDGKRSQEWVESPGQPDIVGVVISVGMRNLFWRGRLKRW